MEYIAFEHVSSCSDSCSFLWGFLADKIHVMKTCQSEQYSTSVEGSCFDSECCYSPRSWGCTEQQSKIKQILVRTKHVLQIEKCSCNAVLNFLSNLIVCVYLLVHHGWMDTNMYKVSIFRQVVWRVDEKKLESLLHRTISKASTESKRHFKQYVVDDWMNHL